MFLWVKVSNTDLRKFFIITVYRIDVDERICASSGSWYDAILVEYIGISFTVFCF